MDFTRLITIDRITCDPAVSSKKRVLEHLSELLAKAADTKATDIFDKLIERERLGSTSLGYGVALPHGRLGQGEDIIGAFVKLPRAIDFDSPDGKPVDLLFALLVPEDHNTQHLETLASIARFFNNSEVRDSLRQAQTAEDILHIFQSRALNRQAS